jgi:AhpD family alkylhydroperoxidase
MGFIPSMMAKFAEAPPLLMGYQALAPFFDKTSFDPAERLVVYLVASYRHNCDFCMSAHSWFARRQGIDEEVITALREGRSLSDPKLEALRASSLSCWKSVGQSQTKTSGIFSKPGTARARRLKSSLGSRSRP